MNRTQRLLYRLIQLIFGLLGRVPADLRRKASRGLGGLIFLLARKHRHIAIDNLTMSLGAIRTASEIEAIARAVFTNLVLIVFEIGWALRLKASRFGDHFTISGADVYEKALSEGKGVLMLLAHFGNWELLPIIAHMLRMPVAIIYRPLDALFLDRFFKESRTRFGARVISKRGHSMRRMYRELREGRVVAMLMDQGVDWYEGVFVDFFNQPACTSTGMAMLAIKSQAPVVPCFLIRTPNGFHAVCGPRLNLVKTGDRAKDIEANTRNYNQVIEHYARRYPEQWFWVHQRWKHKPMVPWPNPEMRNRWLAREKKPKYR